MEAIKISVAGFPTSKPFKEFIGRFKIQNGTRETATTIIQRQCRKYLARNRYCMLRKATIATQSLWRARIARKELRMLKMLARPCTSAQPFKSKLESEVETLTWRLQMAKRIREETKDQENAKCQSAMKEMQKQSEQILHLIHKEREAAKKKQRACTSPQQIKSKLEREVETLIWQLHAAKRIREETKNQENAKWQYAMKGMQEQSEQILELIHKEREAAKKKLEEAYASSKEIVDKLTAENEKLKDMVSTLEHKIQETENKKYEENNKLSEERLQT